MLFLLGYYNDEIIYHNKAQLYTDENLFELFCIDNDFAKYFAECHNLFFNNFVSHIMIFPQNDLISLYCIILRNALLVPE